MDLSVIEVELHTLLDRLIMTVTNRLNQRRKFSSIEDSKVNELAHYRRMYKK